MLLFRTRRSAYALEPTLGLLLQLPGGTDTGLRAGVWHRVRYERQPHLGERFFAAVTPRGEAEPWLLRTGRVEWVGPEPPLPAYVEIGAAERHEPVEPVAG